MSTQPNRKPWIIAGVFIFLPLLACVVCVAAFYIAWNLIPSTDREVVQSKPSAQPVVAISAANMDKVERLASFSQRTEIKSIAWSPDSRLIAAGGNPTQEQRRADRIEPIKIWNVATGEEWRPLEGPQSVKQLAEPQQYENVNEVIDVGFSPDGRYLAATYTYGIKIWNVADGKKVQTINIWNTNMGDVNFSLESDTVFAKVRGYHYSSNVSLECTGMQSWDVVSGRPLRCDADGVYATSQGKVFVRKNTPWFDADTARAIGKYATRAVSHNGQVVAHSSGPIVAESVQATLTLTDIASGKPLGQWNKLHYFSSVAFSADDTLVVAERVGENIFSSAPIMLWDVQSGKMIELTTSLAKSIAFSPDGRFLAVSGSGQVQLWGVKP